MNLVFVPQSFPQWKDRGNRNLLKSLQTPGQVKIKEYLVPHMQVWVWDRLFHRHEDVEMRTINSEEEPKSGFGEDFSRSFCVWRRLESKFKLQTAESSLTANRASW
ncbi:hypothetical protein AMECASPLE_027897 [Ameca splendens]|uniref:Uncharacterized protein n=1 Tax=Ameca splendens TaxID=208324 RepID=A0ABV0YSV1_9TELE